jgi:hypothetical protein
MFLYELQSMVKSCGFCSHCSDLALRDRLIAGARDPDLVDKLLKTSGKEENTNIDGKCSHYLCW